MQHITLALLAVKLQQIDTECGYFNLTYTFSKYRRTCYGNLNWIWIG